MVDFAATFFAGYVCFGLAAKCLRWGGLGAAVMQCLTTSKEHVLFERGCCRSVQSSVATSMRFVLPRHLVFIGQD